MTEKVDNPEENQNDTPDPGKENQDAGSEEAKKDSPKTTKFSKEVEAELQKRVSDALSKRGWEAKDLEGRIKVLESDNTTLKDEKFTDVAKGYGLEVEKLKEAGITDSSKIEAYAELFGKTKEQPPIVQEADSGKTSGGDTTPQSAKGKIQAGWDELHK